ncbi:MAG: hypothetical protein AAFV53_40480 [Myxococcota bacterium]
MKTRREMLSGLGAALTVLGCGRPTRGAPPDAAADACRFEGPTPHAVTGPFAPKAFRPILRDRPNPGAITPTPEVDFDLTTTAGRPGVARGQVVVIVGQVLAPNCQPVSGADLQLWQADAAGHYNHRNEGGRVSATDLDPAFGYWGNVQTDADGRFTLKTIVPGAYPADDGWWRPPHLHWRVAAQGLGQITTQSFFDGDVLDGIKQIRALNRDDLILNIRESFARSWQREHLPDARRRLREEMVANFTAQEGIPTGTLIFHLG